MKSHYKSDWHIFNSKRRANGLTAVTEKDFILSGKKVLNNNKKPAAALLSLPPSPLKGGGKNSEKKQPIKALKEGKDDLRTTAKEIGISEDRIESIISATTSEVVVEDAEDEEDEEIEEEDEVALPTGSNYCIFDNKSFDNVDDNIAYMLNNYGFFLPEQEFLVDKEGLIEYLNEKVKLGGLCIYCQKHLRPGKPVQHHMISKSHCKLAYNEEIDIDEVEDFYDFTSSYEDDNIVFDEDGEVVGVEVTAIGELLLPSGKTVGNRIYNKYYKQRPKVEETRPSVLALQREEVLRLGNQLSNIPGGGTPTDLMKLSDNELGLVLLKYHRAIRKGNIIEQRYQQRRAFIDQRREYRSKGDKARSSATTTAKIRDYHKTVM